MPQINLKLRVDTQEFLDKLQPEVADVTFISGKAAAAATAAVADAEPVVAAQ